MLVLAFLPFRLPTLQVLQASLKRMPAGSCPTTARRLQYDFSTCLR